MKKIKTLLVVSILLLGISQPLRAQSLEVVFKNSLWGAGIGGMLGLASWLMTEDMMANELRIRLIRGSALGALAGVGYGLWETNRGSSGISQKQEPLPALAEYDAENRRLVLQPVLPRLSQQDVDLPGWRWDVMRVRF